MTTRPGRSHADGTVGDARVHAPPGWMEPMLALIERIDRRRLGIRPIRRDGISGLVFTNHRGPDVLLADGVIVRSGDRIGAIHLDNRRLASFASDGWQPSLLRMGRADARALARWLERRPPAERPVAFWGATILWPFGRRLGGNVFERPQTFRVRLEDWYLRGVLRRWARDGAARLALGRGDLRTRECWISAAEVMRRYGTSAGWTGAAGQATAGGQETATRNTEPADAEARNTP